MEVANINVDPDILEKFSLVRAALFRYFPFFANLLPFIKISIVKTDEFKTAQVTSEGEIQFNYDYVKKADTKDIFGSLCHEIMHLVTGDFPRARNFITQLTQKYGITDPNAIHTFYNIVIDVINNELLKEGGIDPGDVIDFRQLSLATRCEDKIKEKQAELLLQLANRIIQQHPDIQAIKFDNNQNQLWTVEKSQIKTPIENKDDNGRTVKTVTTNNYALAYALATLLSGKLIQKILEEYESDMTEKRSVNGEKVEIWRGSQYNPNNWESETERMKMVRLAIEAAKRAGNESLGFLKIIEGLTTPKINWRKYLVRWIHNKLDIWVQTYSRLPRRVDDKRIPGIKTFGLAKVINVFDMSGSISEEEAKQYLTEAHSIVTRLNSELIVYSFDADVYGPYKVRNRSDILKLRLPGGGGTCIKPVIEKLMSGKCKISPNDVVVIFTDGYIYDLDDPLVHSFFTKYKKNIIVVTSGQEVYPELVLNLKV